MYLYNSLNEYLRKKFGSRVQKVCVHMGFTCPNRDGTRGYGGCVYCNNSALYQYESPGTLSQQIITGIERARRKYNAKKFIVYFQSGTNTYGKIEYLRNLFIEAISYPDVVGIAIGTRPDCVDPEILSMLAELSRKTYLWVEYGLQSASDETLQRINRGHTVQEFVTAVERTHSYGIDVCAHVIIGLPGEERENVLETARLLRDVKVDGVKIHAFHVLRDTVVERWYNNNMIKLLSMDEYAGLVVDMLERIPDSVIIHRLTGEAPDNFLVAPQWVKEKTRVLNTIQELMIRRGSFQGKFCQGIHLIGSGGLR